MLKLGFCEPGGQPTAVSRREGIVFEGEDGQDPLSISPCSSHQQRGDDPGW